MDETLISNKVSIHIRSIFTKLLNFGNNEVLMEFTTILNKIFDNRYFNRDFIIGDDCSVNYAFFKTIKTFINNGFNENDILNEDIIIIFMSMFYTHFEFSYINIHNFQNEPEEEEN